MPEYHKIASFYNEAKVKIRKDDYTENDYNEVEVSLHALFLLYYMQPKLSM